MSCREPSKDRFERGIVRIRRRSSLWLVALGIGLLPAIATRAHAEPPPSAEEQLVRWWPTPAPESSAAQRPPALVPVDLPRVAAAGEDMDLGPQVGMHRLVVNLTAEGRLVFQGLSFPFDDTDEAKAKALRRTAAKDLAREWRKAHVGHPQLGLLVRADHRNPWVRVHLLLAWVLGVVDSVDAIHFAVDTGAIQGGVPLDGRLEVLSRAPGEVSNPTITVDLVDAGAAKQPRVVWGERDWTFPAGDPYEAGKAIDEANANWVALLDALRAIPQAPRQILRLAIDPRVPWSHVAQILGLVRLAGIANVDLVRERLALTLSTPVHDLALRPNARAASNSARIPESSSLVLILILGGLLLAVGVGLGAWVRRRRAAAFPEVLVGRRGPKPVPTFYRESTEAYDETGAPMETQTEAPASDDAFVDDGASSPVEETVGGAGDANSYTDPGEAPAAPESEGRDAYPSDG